MYGIISRSTRSGVQDRDALKVMDSFHAWTLSWCYNGRAAVAWQKPASGGICIEVGSRASMVLGPYRTAQEVLSAKRPASSPSMRCPTHVMMTMNRLWFETSATCRALILTSLRRALHPIALIIFHRSWSHRRRSRLVSQDMYNYDNLNPFA